MDNSGITHRAFFGDGEREFVLTVPMVVELERKTGIGIGALCQRLFQNKFEQADISETIRLGLIGGGTSPKEADALIAAYATGRPLMEIYPLAVSILEALMFGSAKPKDKVEA